MTETEYWARHIRPLLVPRVYAWKINASYAKGIPDWWGSGTRQDLWVENKRIDRDAARPPKLLDLTDYDKYLTFLQQQWLVDRHNEGRNVGVLVFSKIGHLWLPGLEWQMPITRESFEARALDKKALTEHLIEILGELPLPSGL